METEPIIETRSLGMQLHAAETAIYLGKRVVAEIYSQEPVDEVALATARQDISAARQTRNTLRRQLEATRPTPIPKYKW